MTVRGCKSRILYRLTGIALTFALLILLYMCLWRYLNSETCWSGEDLCGHDGMYRELPAVEPEKNKSVIIVESFGNSRIVPRIWCTVESASRSYRNDSVYILTTSRSILVNKLMTTLVAERNNIVVGWLDVDHLFSESPLEDWYHRKLWTLSAWPLSHFSDAVKWLVLWKFGGLYLDIDSLVLRPCRGSAFVGLESKDWVGVGVLRFPPRHPVLGDCLHFIASNNPAPEYGSFGPVLLTDVLKARCKLRLSTRESSLCPDLTVFSPVKFNPVPWFDSSVYWRPDSRKSRELLGNPDISAFHVWNYFLQRHPVHVASDAPYAAVARTVCPTTVSMVGDVI